MCVRMRVRVCMRVRLNIRTHDHDQDTNGTRTNGTPPLEKERNTGNTEKPAYIGKIADNEKKYKKKLKKIWKYKKAAVSLCP